MTLNIKNKRSAALNSQPTAAQLEDGEIGINYNADSLAIYVKDSSGSIRQIAGSGGEGMFWDLSGTTLSPDSNTYGLDIGNGDILLNPDGSAAYAGKVTSAETVAGDGDTTLVTKGYVDGLSGDVESVTGTAPISVDSADPKNPDVSITAATTSAAGSMSAADKTKLDGITAGAAVTKITAGTNVTINPTGGTGNVTINATGGEIFVEEEGTQLATAATTLNFTGAGVTASGTGATKEINVPVQPGGTTTGGSTDLVFQENTMVCTASYTLTTGRSALSAGPITINNTVVITIPNNQNWVIL